MTSYLVTMLLIITKLNSKFVRRRNGQLLKTSEADVCLSKKKVIHPHPLVHPRVKGLKYCKTPKNYLATLKWLYCGVMG